MKMQFSHEEGRVLHGLIEDASGDIVIRLDPSGFILHASENVSELGMDLSSLLFMPHIADLADPKHGPSVANFVAKAFAGEAQPGWIEFPLHRLTDEEDEEGVHPSWYAFSMRCIDDEVSGAKGALGLLRNVKERHALEGEINLRALKDPLTGLANRDAFFGQLRRSIALGDEQTIAVLGVDRLRAIFMQYGQRTADEIQWGFAKFLETMATPGQEVAQLDAERFAVLLPNMSIREARRWAEELLQTFAGLTVTASKSKPELSASAGLARVEVNVDWTMRQAELGLVMARAGGGMQVGICGHAPSSVASGAQVEHAMEQAVKRAAKRHG